MSSGVLDLVTCPDPECLSPAEVLDRSTVDGTAGPVEWLVTLCLRGHRFAGVPGDSVQEA